MFTLLDGEVFLMLKKVIFVNGALLGTAPYLNSLGQLR